MKKILLDCVDILDFKRIPLSANERARMKKIYPYYGAQGIIDYVEDFIFDGEYILIAEDGENLRSLSKNIATWATGKFWVNNHAHILGYNGNSNLRFIYYLLSSMDLRRYVTGSAQPKLNQYNLANLEIDLPPLEVQKQIGNFLYSLDKKISLNKKINATLEEMAKTIYDYYFVQFDFSDENGKPYKSSGGKMIFSPELQREIPEGWEVKKLSDFGNLKNGINYEKNTVGDKIFKIVNVKNISDSKFSILTETLDDINLPSKNAKNYLTTEEDILIARSGTPGAVRVITGKNKAVIFCGFIICLKLNDKISKNYLMFTLQKNYEIIATKSAGTILKNITQDTLKNFLFVTPPTKILENFNAKVEPIILKINKNLQENNLLENLRDFLLPMLMNGQVGFKEKI